MHAGVEKLYPLCLFSCRNFALVCFAFAVAVALLAKIVCASENIFRAVTVVLMIVGDV